VGAVVIRLILPESGRVAKGRREQENAGDLSSRPFRV
jgi:hypothetical protein